MADRPSHKEVLGKILNARTKIAGSDWAPADFQALLPEFDALDLITTEEHNRALESALNEIRPEHYAGYRPPQKSYEQVCREAELFAFAWDSAFFGCRMYLKFCFVKETLYIVSFHKSRRADEEEPWGG